MVYKVSVENIEEFESLIAKKHLKISQEIIKKILKNLNKDKKYIHVLEVYVEDLDQTMDLTVERENIIETLELNLKIHEFHEDYEGCSKIQEAIKIFNK
jgi:hypothetical protein|tara:strand:+ start:1902 stop:2198 length:297 start_codon:yes stop_codon:yes gene_type:complete